MVRFRRWLFGAFCLAAFAAAFPSAMAEDLGAQVRELQAADRQRQLELEQLRASNRELQERLDRLQGVRQEAASGSESGGTGSDGSALLKESAGGSADGTAPAAKPAEPKKGGGVRAGYNRSGGVNPREDGFYIKNADDTFSLHIRNRVQLRYDYDHFNEGDTRNGVPALDRQTDRSDFHIAREYLTFNGNAWSKDLFYQVTLEAYTANNEAVRLRYVWVDYNLLHGTGWADDCSGWRNVVNFRAGLWKGWFGREFPASDGEMQLVDRALATQAFNEGRMRGVGLFGSWGYRDEDRDESGKIRGMGRFAYFLELCDGINNAAQAYNLDNSTSVSVPLPPPANPAPVRQLDDLPSLTCRLQYDVCRGWYTYVLPDGTQVRANDFRFNEENDLACHEQPAVQVGGSYIFDPDNFDAQPVNNPLMGRFFKGKFIHRTGADLALKYAGFSLTGEYYLESIEARPDSRYNAVDFSTGATIPANQRVSQFSHGFYVRGGYFIIPRRLELVSRVSGLFANDLAVLSGGQVVSRTPVNDAWEYTAGIGYYPTGHHYLKIQTDCTYLTNSPVSAEKSEFTSATHESDLIARVQLQLEF